MSIFSTLNVGARALNTSQLAIDVTGQNIANADVAGYSRKRLNISTMYSQDTIYGQIGLGAQVVNIERMRNVFIDAQIRKQNTEVGYFSQVTDSFLKMETILTEPSDLGVMNTIDSFFDAWHNLTNNPSDLASRTTVMTEANIMIDYFRKTARELEDLREQQNGKIPVLLDKINQITLEIFNLNMEVAAVEVRNQHANDSRDKRDLLLKELAGLIDFNVTENASGQVTITTGGSVLVSQAYRQELETTTTTYKKQDGTTYNEIGIRFSNTRQTLIPAGGELRGLIDCRDTYIPEFQRKLDELALAIVQSVNALHVTGYNLDGYSGMNFFETPLTEVDDYGNPVFDIHGNPKIVLEGFASRIALAPAIKTDVRNIAAATAEQSRTATSNLGYYEDALGVRQYLHNYGSEPMPLYRDGTPADPANPGVTDVRARNIISNSVVIEATLGSGNKIVLKEGIDYHIDYNLGTLQMLHDGYDNVELEINFDYYVGGFKGPGDASNAIAIAELRTALTMTPDVLGENTATFAEYVSAVIGRLGLSTNQAAANLETRTFLAWQYEAQQDMVSGVSLDEEMANLVRFQHTYTAAARLITTVDQMLQTLLNM